MVLMTLIVVCDTPFVLLIAYVLLVTMIKHDKIWDKQLPTVITDH